MNCGVGGPLIYDSVQLVQNSVALNGSQRVLLDQVISEEECSELKNLAHVSAPHGSEKIETDRRTFDWFKI